MTPDLPVLPDTSVLANLLKAPSPEEKRQWARMALELVDVDWAPRPVPRAFLDLPRAEDDDEDVAWDIAARVLASSTPYDAEAAGKVKLSELAGQKLVVHDLRVQPISTADLEDDPTRRVGAYLVLAVSRPGETDQTVAFTASPRVVAPLIYAFARGDMPIEGSVVTIGKGKGKRSAPLAFVVQRPF